VLTEFLYMGFTFWPIVLVVAIRVIGVVFLFVV